MPRYRLKPVEVEAVKYDGQRVDDLPAWAQNHSDMGQFGEQKIGKSPVGELLVPVKGVTTTCRYGDYLVFTPADEPVGGVLSVVPARDFEAAYEALEAISPAETPAPVETEA